MHAVEVVPGQDYSSAVELPLGGKYLRHVNGTQKASSGNSGAGKPVRTASAALKGMLADQQKLDRALTIAGQKRLVIWNGKRRWILETDYKAGTWKQQLTSRSTPSGPSR